MIYDWDEINKNFALAYADKSRIFFIEHYLYTFNAIVGKKTPFMLFPRQKEFLKSLANNRASIAIKPRQCGITTVSSAYVCAEMIFADPESPKTILCIGNKLDLANQLVTKIRDFIMCVPRYFFGDEYFSPDPKSEKNKKDIFIKNSKSELELFNGCRVVARSSGENAARGISAAWCVIFDEAAFIENGQAVYASAVATQSSVPDAKTIVVSTPNGKDPLYYSIYKNAQEKKNNFNVVEFRWYQDPRYNRFLKWWKIDKTVGEKVWYEEPVIDSDGNIKYDEEHWRDMVSKDWKPFSPWYDTMCQQFNQDTVKIAQELDVSFVGSSDNVVAPEYIEMQQTQNVREPLDDFKDPMVPEFWAWSQPIDGHRYLLALDPSGGSSADNSAIEIIDIDAKDANGMPTVEQVAECVFKRLGDDLAEIVYNYARMYNNAFVVVDCTNGLGDTTILNLMNRGYKNIYYDNKELSKYTVQSPDYKTVDQRQAVPGLHMQGIRFQLLSYFANMVRNNAIKIRSQRVINELETWIFAGEAKRMDHMSGSHDDTICSLAMATFVLEYSYNKLEASKSKDAAILSAYMTGGRINQGGSRIKDSQPISATKKGPYWGTSGNSNRKRVSGNFMWLFR